MISLFFRKIKSHDENKHAIVRKNVQRYFFTTNPNARTRLRFTTPQCFLTENACSLKSRSGHTSAGANDRRYHTVTPGREPPALRFPAPLPVQVACLGQAMLSTRTLLSSPCRLTLSIHSFFNTGIREIENTRWTSELCTAQPPFKWSPSGCFALIRDLCNSSPTHFKSS